MNTPPSSTTRCLLLLTGCALAAAVYVVAPARAASGGPVSHTYFTVSVAPSVVKSDATTTEVPGSSSSKPGTPSGSGYGGNGFGGGRNRGGGFGGNGNTGTSDFSSQADVTYTITVRNITKFPVKNLAVEYHFYNLTTDTSSEGLTTHRIQDIAGSENIDIDASSISKPITTKPVHRADSASTAHSFGPSTNSGGGRTVAGKTTSRESSSITDLLGYRVEVRYNNELVGSTESPMDLKDKLASYAPPPDATASSGTSTP